MFLENKYTNWYYAIISNAREKNCIGYTEKHHIVPKSLGGSNANDNIAILSAREHFVCHLLLIKMTTGKSKSKMFNALSMMLAKNKNQKRNFIVTARVFENLKTNLSKIAKDKWTPELRKEKSKEMTGEKNPFFKKNHSLETKLKMSNKIISSETKNLMSMKQKERFENQKGTFLGKHHSDETKEKIRKARLGKVDSEKTKQAKSIAGKNRPPITDETRKKLSIAAKNRPGLVGEKNGFYGKHHSEEQKEKKRREKLNSPRLTCIHCSKIIDNMNYARWHGDKCKKRK